MLTPAFGFLDLGMGAYDLERDKGNVRGMPRSRIALERNAFSPWSAESRVSWGTK